MKKTFKRMLCVILAAQASYLNAHTNKTFLNPRSHGVNLPMEYTTFNELINRKDEDKFGGNFQVTAFYQASTNGKELAKYFLINNKSTITFAGAPTNTQNTAPLAAGTDVDVFYLIHNNDQADTKDQVGKTTLSLDPKQTSWGFRFDYHQDLDKIMRGLYLKVNLPVVHIENDLNLDIDSTGKLPAVPEGLFPDTSLQNVLIKFFAGNYANAQKAEHPGNNAGASAGNAHLAGSNNQVALTNARMDGAKNDTGVADIDMTLGYKFLNKESYYAAIALAVTIPTGEEADGVNVFDALVGNGKHFGFGGDLMAQWRAWGHIDHNLKIDFWVKYRYLFENSEKRTFGFKNLPNTPFGQYYLLVRAGQPRTDKDAVSPGLIPAANVTTLNVEVTPGSQFDGILGLEYNNCNFVFDIGYNMYFRQEEDVELKDTFPDNQYAIANRAFDTSTGVNSPFTENAPGTAVNSPLDRNDLMSTLVTDDLDIDGAQTPSQFTHTIYAAFGYIFKEWESPLMIGLGGKYEWPSRNSALEQWSIWGKLGVGF